MFEKLDNLLAPKNLAALTCIALIYCLAGKLGMRLAFIHPLVTPIWLPSGIALAASILYGYRVWPAIFVGSFLSHATTSVPSFLIPVGVTLEGLAGAYLVNKFAHGAKAFDTAKGVFCLCWSDAYALL
jgi:integral membrane sensor domain MASE1